MNIAIFSGEVSGDLIAGALVRAIKEREPNAIFWGMGSNSLQSAGAELIANSAEWGAIGVTEAFRVAPKIFFKILPMLKRALTERRPDVVVLIDFGAVNMQIARHAKKIGLKVLYYFPPGSWRRTAKPSTELAKITDVLASPFLWSHERYKADGCNSVYVGHPLLERVHPSMTREQFAESLGLSPDKPIIGLLPGSRRQEVVHLVPTLIETAKTIWAQVPDAQFVMSVAPTISEETLRNWLAHHSEFRDKIADIWHEFIYEAETKILRPVARTARRLSGQPIPQFVTAEGVVVSADKLEENRTTNALQQNLSRPKGLPPIVLAKGVTYDIMAYSHVLLACSGTATLEATLFETPMVILYRGSKIMELESILRGTRKKLRFMGLPNIIADRSVVAELIQEQANPEAITQIALPLLNDVTARQKMKAELRAIKESLGEPGASAKTAELVLELAKK